MCQRPQLRLKFWAEPEGFTLMEVLVSITILAIGLMASALLMSTTYKDSMRSRYMSEAAQLASEKLEDLRRLTVDDASIAVPSGSSEGSLASDSGPTSITDVNGNVFSVIYYDTVFLAAAGAASGSVQSTGTLSETYQTSSTNYSTLSYSANGQTPVVTNSSTAPTLGETFDRRWLIEANQPISGVRRITVLVTLMDQTVQPPVTFQMSMVRP